MSGIPLLTLAADSAKAIADKLANDAIPSQSGLLKPKFVKYLYMLRPYALNQSKGLWSGEERSRVDFYLTYAWDWIERSDNKSLNN